MGASIPLRDPTELWRQPSTPPEQWEDQTDMFVVLILVALKHNGVPFANSWQSTRSGGLEPQLAR